MIPEKKSIIDISVRDLIHYVYRGGDLDARFVGKSRVLEGTKAHQVIQNKMGDNYASEVSVKHVESRERLTINLSGRVDGIIKEDDHIIIDEIKSTLRNLEEIEIDDYPLHWMQAKIYAYIYAAQHNFEKISVQLTYVEIDNYEVRRFIKDFDFKDLKEDFLAVIEDYLEFAYRIDDWSKIRDESIMKLKFPFDPYRKGQREMAVCVYKTIKEKKKAFIQAPTGIGKTISTIFPTVKAIAEGHTSKIFYLTAKTITRTVAQEAFNIMRKKGLRFKSLTITAKDKICFEPDCACIPQECSYAKGHFNRVNDAVKDMMLNEDEFSKAVIEEYSKKHHVCPFEFSLDAALVADCVICDYNYVFDPRVNLKRFFEDVTKDYAFLVDEAHNLVDRARGMYSAVINKQPLLQINRSIKNKKEDEKLVEFSKIIIKYNKALLQYKNDCIEKDEYVFKEPPAELYRVMRSFANQADVILNERKELSCYDLLLDYYFQTLTFLNISELYDERYTTYVELKGNDIYINLFCVDPSYLLNQRIANGAGAIFFSATLSPIKYFHRMYSHNKEDYTLLLDSPFDHGNRSYLIASDIMTTYKKRAFSYEDIALYLREFAQSKLGNYIVYFSSYAYKKEVLDAFEMLETDIKILDQQRELTEIEKEEFLDKFELSPEKSMMGFCVLGGSFSEGVDLRGDRLIGTVIVGVGLPMVCLEREIIKNYHEDHDEEAFNYAYVYPGLNKVMQAAGRVIRTEEDTGVIILMDERYNYSSYRQVIPYDWQPRRTYRRSFRNDIDEVWNQIDSQSISSFEK
jgi:DNA excision repair protein ERCC-2